MRKGRGRRSRASGRNGGGRRADSAGSGDTEFSRGRRRRCGAGGAGRSRGRPESGGDTQDLPAEARSRPLHAGAADRRECRQRAGRRARARLAELATRTTTAAGTPESRGTTTARPSRATTTSPCTAPPARNCFGECAYWEADTALTGLALLTYLGAGYTHTDGRYAEVVGKGLDFLIAQQKPDGDLRGRSQVVGMYCHAMATLAMCEAYALTGDDRLRGPAERAVAFLVRGRARDGMAWRYAPAHRSATRASWAGW